MKWQKFQLIDGEQIIVTPCFEVVAFTDEPISKCPAGLSRFYQVFMDRYGSMVRFYQTNDMRRAKKITEKEKHIVPFWFDDETAIKQPLLGIYCHSGGKSSSVLPPTFQFMYDQVNSKYPRGGFRITLPIEAVAEDLTDVLEMVRLSLDTFPLAWGYAGYSFVWSETNSDLNDQAVEWIGPLLKKHPGFSCGEILEFLTVAEEGVGNISWLTFLGERYTSKLGGLYSISKTLGEGNIVVKQLGENNTIIQAGMSPKVGDVNRRDFLPLYCQVGRSLEAVKIPDAVIDEMDIEGLEGESIKQWLTRFF